MPIYRADAALLPDGIAANVLIAVEGGRIARVETGAPESPGEVKLQGLVLPGMANVHSHAFQRAMAGLTEWDAGGEDNFWSWREAMYRFAVRLDPESQRAIALFLYVEMLKAGYTAVGEFHYLHNQPDGSAYAPPEAMAQAIVSAAADAGIAMALLPTLYMQGGVDGRPLSARQQRFGKTVDSLLKLRQSFSDSPGIASLGVAIHSVRAVPPQAIHDLVSQLEADSPLHIHAAEQAGEVEETLAAYGKRPVEYLLDNFEIGPRWCLVHATHLTADETLRFAQSGGTAGICPTTEANLGDGIFPLTDYLGSGGKIAIGGDSHVGVDPAEELRWLDYVQRLALRRRNVTATLQAPHTAARLWCATARGGAQALGLGAGEISEGARADLVVLDPDHPSFAARDGAQILDTYVFVAGRAAVRDVMVDGNWVVKNHRHALEEQAAAGWRKTLEKVSA